MKIRVIGICLAAVSIFVTSVSAQKIHPITQAMLDGYEELLRQNPDDWFTLYERASQYYRLNYYDKALTDIRHAISCTPLKEKEQLSSEYALAADIYTQTGDYDSAFDCIEKALANSPGSYSLLYQKGNISLYLGNIPEARKCFQSMMRLKSRSQEAMFGLAKCALLEDNVSEARTYMEQAEKVDPSNYLTYCRLGDLYSDMDEIQNAAASYLSAFSLNSKDDRSLSSLLSLGERDYSAVVEALDYAIGKTSNTVPLLFLKGNIAKNTGHVSDAYDAYSKLILTPQGGAPEVLVPMAEICRDKNSLTEALGYADRAVSLSGDPRSLVLKAKIQYDLKDYGNSLSSLGKALEVDSEMVEALLLAAECQLALEDYSKAVSFLNQAVGADPLDPRPLMLRGYLATVSDVPGLPGNADFVRVTRLTAEDDDAAVYKAIAQMLCGKSLDASETMKPIMAKSSSDAKAAYLTSLFYSSTGNVEKGKESLSKAVKLGFDNPYLLETYSVPMFSIAPLR